MKSASLEFKTSGITLAELMVVVFLVSFLGLLGTYMLFDADAWLAHYRLRAAARDLYSNMQKARMQAIRENRSWAIVFDVEGNRYILCSDKGPDGVWSSYEDNTIVETINLSSYKSGVTYGAGTATHGATSDEGGIPSDFVSFNYNVVVFGSEGYPSTSGYCYLTNKKGEACAVGALTSGVITVKVWNGTTWE